MKKFAREGNLGLYIIRGGDDNRDAGGGDKTCVRVGVCEGECGRACAGVGRACDGDGVMVVRAWDCGRGSMGLGAVAVRTVGVVLPLAVQR